MHITVLHTESCPNTEPLIEDLHNISAGFNSIIISTQCICTEEEAVQHGFHGSPTILLDGKDPFSYADYAFGLSCRIYSEGSKRYGYPTHSQLIKVLHQAELPDNV